MSSCKNVTIFFIPDPITLPYIENKAFMEFDSLYINTLTKEGLIFDFVGGKYLYCRCLAVVLMI